MNGVKAEDDAARRGAERARLNDEISQLKELLESTRTARREALEQSEAVKQEVDAAKRQVDSLQVAVQTLESDKAEVRHIVLSIQMFLINPFVSSVRAHCAGQECEANCRAKNGSQSKTGSRHPYFRIGAAAENCEPRPAAQSCCAT